jgi:hypothetical protein
MGGGGLAFYLSAMPMGCDLSPLTLPSGDVAGPSGVAGRLWFFGEWRGPVVRGPKRRAERRGDVRGIGERDGWSAVTERSGGTAPVGRTATERERPRATCARSAPHRLMRCGRDL